MSRTITLEGRANEYRNDFEIYEGTLRCKFCNKSFSYQIKSVLDRHIKSETHKNSKYGGIQTHLTLSNTETIKKLLILETIEIFIKNDIPLYKFDSMKSYFTKHILNGGMIPNSTQLRKCYLPKYYNLQIEVA